MDRELRNRLNFLEGEVDTLETIMAEMVAAMVSNQLVDGNLTRRTIEGRIATFTVRQHDDLIMGTPSEHYFKGAIQALDKVGENFQGELVSEVSAPLSAAKWCDDRRNNI